MTHEAENQACAETISPEDRHVLWLQAEVEYLTKAGIIEVAVRNQSVSEYMDHWETRAEKAEAKLSGVHAGTHVIVPYEFIELAVDPIGADECGNIKQYVDNIEAWADRIRRKAEPFLHAMLLTAKDQ